MPPTKKSSVKKNPPPKRIKLNGHVEGLYQQLIDQAADGIFTISLKGVILYANKAARIIVNTSGKSLIGKHFLTFIDNSSQLHFKSHISQVKKGVLVVRDELIITTKKNRKIPIEFTASPIFKQKDIVQIHIGIRDISIRKALEEKVKETEKMEAMQHFISGATQEIQYPLKGLYAQAQTLIEKYKGRDFEYIGFKEYTNIFKTLETMRDQVKYCYDTTDRLINISKKRVGIKQNRSQVNQVIHQVVDIVKHSVSTGDIKIDVKRSAKLPIVAIGEIELNQILMIILTNAVQALPGGGTVKIKSTYRKGTKQVCIDCIDNGVGIPRDHLSRIFDPFFTTKQRGLEKSSGLGLSIVHSLLKSHNGDIEVKSSLRSGTHVKITLPIV